MSSNDPREAYVRIDLCVFGIVQGQFCVLVVRRERWPEYRKWVLPGTPLDTRVDRDLDSAAARVSGDRLRVQLPGLKQLGAFGGTEEANSKWVLNVVYRASIRPDAAMLNPGEAVTDRKWLPVSELDGDIEIGFNHRQIIARAVTQVREEVNALIVPFHLLPSSFTIAQLRTLCEQILSKPLDKAAFRRRVLDRDLLVETGQLVGGAHRPAMLYVPAE